MKTNDKNKIYWHLNWILVAVVFVVLTIVFLCRYFGVGHPVEATWTEEVFKYLFMWPAISVGAGTVLWVPFKALAAKIAKDRGGEVESAEEDK